MTAALAPIWSDEDALGQNLPETPAPATGWPQEDWGPRLAAYAAGLDSGFVRGGEILVGAIDTIYAMFDGLDKLAEVLNPHSVGASVHALRSAAGQIANLPDQLAQRSQDLATAASHISQLRSSVAHIQRILQVLEIYGMNIKIAGALGNYRAFVDEMADKLKQGAANIESFDTRLASVGASIGEVRKLGARMQANQRQGGPIAARLDSCAGQMEAHFITVSQMIHAMGEIAHKVEDRVGAVLSSIQVADSTRQRIEHIVAIITHVETQRQKGGVPPGALAHMAALVAAQTDATAAAFAGELQQLQQSLVDLAMAGRDLSGLTDRLGQTEGATSLQELEARIAEVGPVTDQIQTAACTSAQMSGEIAAALGELEGRMDNINDIVREVKTISLNTRLLCHQQGVEGRAVAVIAVEIAVQASQLNEQAMAIAQAMGKLDSCNARLGSADQTGPDPAGHGALAAVMATMRDACLQADEAVDRGNTSCRKLVTDLDRVAIGVGENLGADQTLAVAARAFGGHAPALLDGPSHAWLAAHLPGFAALYTMAAERQIHARFVPETMAGLAPVPAQIGGEIAAPPPPLAPEDDVDEDGLF